MGDVLDLAERAWRGEISPRELWRPTGRQKEIAVVAAMVGADPCEVSGG